MALPQNVGGGTAESADTLALRWAGSFAILVASLVGAWTPLASGTVNGMTARLLKAFAAGSLIGLALIHILADSFEDFERAGQEYCWGAFSCGAAMLVMMVIDHGHAGPACPSMTWHDAGHDAEMAMGGAKAPAVSQTTSNSSPSNLRLRNAPSAQQQQEAAAAPLLGHDHLGHVEREWLSSQPQRHAHHLSHQADTSMGGLGPGGKAPTSASSGNGCPHTHYFGATESTGQDLHRQAVVGYLMELGCVFHSLIIGLDVGIMTDDGNAVAIMVGVLCIHQLIEGVCLGTVIRLAPFSPAKRNSLLLLYAATTPAGIVLGILLSSNTWFDPHSARAAAVAGALNGVSSGLLLHVAYVNLLVEELTRPELHTRPLQRTRYAMYAAMFSGFACMAGLGLVA